MLIGGLCVEDIGMMMKSLVPLQLRRVYRSVRASAQKYLHTEPMLRDLRGNRVQCPVCKWRGLRFLDDAWHQGSTCPKCQSGVRQRLLLASFRYLPEFSSRIFLADKDILHFAPESEVSRYLSRLTRKYFTADLGRSDVNINLI